MDVYDFMRFSLFSGLNRPPVKCATPLLNTLRSSLREFNLVNCPSVPVKQKKTNGFTPVKQKKVLVHPG